MTDSGAFDYVVVGAGAAGCVLAERLSRDGRSTVCVLEAGSHDRAAAVRIPGAVIGALANPRFDWCFKTEPDPSRLGRSEIWSRGKVVGGSGAINGLFFVRGRPSDYDGWAARGNQGWSYQDLLPHFKVLENYSGGDPLLRGRSGPFSVSDIARPHILSQLFVEAAREAGIPTTPDYNGAQHEGASLAQTSVRRGFRETAWRAILKPAVGRKNLTIMTRSRVERLVIEGTRVVGVHVLRDGHACILRARREVILSAGSIGSPQILLLSGIGPAQELRELGITPQLDLPGVGKNMQEHAGIWMVSSLKPGIRTANMDYNAWGAVRHGLQFLLSRTGTAASPSAQALAFAKTAPEQADPDVQIHFMPLGYHILPDRVEVMRTPAMMAVPNLNRPLSRGRVSLTSADPNSPPRIEPNLLERPEDVQRLIAGTRLVRRIFAAPAFQPYVEQESFPGPSVQSDEDWERVLREHVKPVYHVVGTCKMGNDALSVVDDRLRLRGLQGLRVIDSSIMPVITSGNTHAPSLVIGSKGAELVLADAIVQAPSRREVSRAS